MRQLFYLTGQINSSFFINEIPYLVKNFDEVIVFSYNDERKKCDELSKKYHFKYEFISFRKDIFKTLLLFFTKWIWLKHVKKEIGGILREKSGVKKTIYALSYGFFACRTKSVIDSYLINSNADVYFYSFWLSRFSYAISLYNIKRSNKIKKIVSRAHRYDLYEEENSLCYLPFREFLDKNLDKIYFIAKTGKEYFSLQRY